MSLISTLSVDPARVRIRRGDCWIQRADRILILAFRVVKSIIRRQLPDPTIDPISGVSIFDEWTVRSKEWIGLLYRFFIWRWSITRRQLPDPTSHRIQRVSMSKECPMSISIQYPYPSYFYSFRIRRVNRGISREWIGLLHRLLPK
jgi:hypothetical protein